MKNNGLQPPETILLPKHCIGAGKTNYGKGNAHLPETARIVRIKRREMS
jgi:hypothetical protein